MRKPKMDWERVRRENQMRRNGTEPYDSDLPEHGNLSAEPDQHSHGSGRPTVPRAPALSPEQEQKRLATLRRQAAKLAKDTAAKIARKKRLEELAQAAAERRRQEAVTEAIDRKAVEEAVAERRQAIAATGSAEVTQRVGKRTRNVPVELAQTPLAGPRRKRSYSRSPPQFRTAEP